MAMPPSEGVPGYEASWGPESWYTPRARGGTRKAGGGPAEDEGGPGISLL